MNTATVPPERHNDILTRLPDVWIWAKRLWRRKPGITWRDLAQEGLLALCRASTRYDATRATFSTYTDKRLPGAMRDFISMGTTAAFPLSLDAPVVDPKGEAFDSLYEALPAAPARSQDLFRDRLLQDALARLSPQQQRVMMLYYYEGYTMKEIGVVLGVIESRVSQIHTAACARLRRLLAPYQKELTCAD
jgi:RNA polymerase sigma factor (sigma-70 family)